MFWVEFFFGADEVSRFGWMRLYLNGYVYLLERHSVNLGGVAKKLTGYVLIWVDELQVG